MSLNRCSESERFVILMNIHVIVCSVCCLSLSHLVLSATPWTVAHQAPLSMEFSREEYWSGLSFPSPGIFLTRHCRQSLYCFTTWEAHKDDLFCSCCLVALSCLTLGDTMDRGTPALPALQCLSEFAQTHVHWVDDAIRPSHPLCSLLLLPSVFPSITVFSPVSWLITSGGQNNGAPASASVRSINIQGWFPLGLASLISCSSRDSQESFPASHLQFLTNYLHTI